MALQEELERQGNWLFKHRSYLPLIILLIGTILHLRSELYETFILEETPYEIYYERLCLLVSLSGLVIRIYTVGYTPSNTSGRNTKGQLADSLNTTGIYSLVRHPLYIGNFFMWFGAILTTGNFWFAIAFILAYWVYYERIMFAEEQFLRKKFGTAYIEWAEKTPAFIPSFNRKKFIKPKYRFSWKKVLKKEKNGLAAILLIFTFFNVTGELIDRDTDFDYWILALTLLTGLMYLILKYLKKYTRLLNETGK
ncbi:isoprenylcysteine carboxylmethyltransferase family protein [Proteiniphilum sp.]|uniref:methyltransferase family protein n=1 Tax=Proteiniphilum sp. TaxID=1926877 RepID=UPI002B1FB911|nr:isoprenylcysteine carboxylmethyltransferase family protein [Proteiniphilum sp.]MEA4916887.1 isoprenylcysteine carboxylmethyltransferase family protein [Proteiniphilum sp.]